MSSDGPIDIEQRLATMQQRLRENCEQLRVRRGGPWAALSPRFAVWGGVVAVVLVSIVLVYRPATRMVSMRQMRPAGSSSTALTVRWFSPTTTAKAKSWLMRWWPTASDRAAASADMPGSALRVYFDFDRDTLRPESATVLKEIADILTRHPDWKLSIGGHTDNIGPDGYNLDLSNRRAATVKKALVEDYHIDSERLTTEGFGATRPQDSNQTRTGRARNRRVEVLEK